jgi:hypothetical protein
LQLILIVDKNLNPGYTFTNKKMKEVAMAKTKSDGKEIGKTSTFIITERDGKIIVSRQNGSAVVLSEFGDGIFVEPERGQTDVIIGMSGTEGWKKPSLIVGFKIGQ